MYNLLSTTEVSAPHSHYVNAALCKYLLDTADTATTLAAKKSAVRREETKVHVPFWSQFHELRLDDENLQELVAEFQRTDNYYTLYKATELWKQQVVTKLKKFHQKHYFA
jgi:hypothetical protein